MSSRGANVVKHIVIWVPLVAVVAVGMSVCGLPSEAFGATSGWLSAGLFSIGVASAGLFSIGVYSAGLFSIGIFSAGVFSIGIFSFGTFVIGVWAAGQFALGRWTTEYHRAGATESGQ